jgi:hypothetical protein
MILQNKLKFHRLLILIRSSLLDTPKPDNFYSQLQKISISGPSFVQYLFY